MSLGQGLSWQTRAGRIPQKTRQDKPMLDYCWASVVDGGPTLIQHRSCILGGQLKPEKKLISNRACQHGRWEANLSRCVTMSALIYVNVTMCSVLPLPAWPLYPSPTYARWWPNIGSTLSRRQRCWLNVEPMLGRYLLLAELYNNNVMRWACHQVMYINY